MDNVIKMPTQADNIADQIRDHIAGMKQAEGDWRDHAIALCEQVAAAKALYPRTKEFGAWWDAQEFELNHQTRAAIVAMGQNMDHARRVIEVTDRRSLHTVFEFEFKQLTNICKSPPPEPPKATVAQETAKVIKVRKADLIVEQMFREEQEGIPLPKNGPEIMERTGCKTSMASDAMYAIRTEVMRRETTPAPPPVAELVIDPETLPKSWAEKFEIAKRQMEKQLRAEFDDKVEAKAAEILEITLQHYAKKIEFADNFKRNYNPRLFPFTADEFKKIIACVHPDRVQDEALKARYSAVFNLMNEKKAQLVMPDPPEGKTAAEFPRTSAEILARRKR